MLFCLSRKSRDWKHLSLRFQGSHWDLGHLGLALNPTLWAHGSVPEGAQTAHHKNISRSWRLFLVAGEEVACFPCPFALSFHILSFSGGQYLEGSCQSGFPVCHSKDLSGSLQWSSSAHSWHYDCRSNWCMWLSCLDGYLCRNAGSCYLCSLLMCQAGTLDLWVLKWPPPRAMNGEDIQQETKWQRYPVIKIRSLWRVNPCVL